MKLPRMLAALAFAALLSPGAQGASFAAPLLSGEVEIAFEGDSETLSLAKDYTATITLTAPASLKVSMPDLDALRMRFQGFAVAEGYGREPRALPDGRVETASRWRLVPDPAAGKYRLAPFAVDVRDALGNDRGSFATSPVLFPVASLPPAEGSVEIAPKKFFVMPTARTFLHWSLWALGLAAAVALAVFLARRIHRAVKLRRMTPSERAFAELAALLERRLTDRGLFKDYYVELTHVVRRYIERAYKIRAPRLTTEEFLAAARKHPHFTDATLSYLSEFLHSADMVKFAGQSATSEIASDAAASARRYIERDSAESAHAAPGGASSQNGASAGQSADVE